MASILDQYEEESARATSISSVTPIQVPVSSNTFYSLHIEGTFMYIVFSIILKHIKYTKFSYLDSRVSVKYYCLVYSNNNCQRKHAFKSFIGHSWDQRRALSDLILSVFSHVTHIPAYAYLIIYFIDRLAQDTLMQEQIWIHLSSVKRRSTLSKYMHCKNVHCVFYYTIM